MAGTDNSARVVQHEFSTAKSVLILAVVIGCFAILWPRVFHPMMQATLMKKTASTTNKEGDSGNVTVRPLPSRCNPVCCGVIYENKIDFKFFAELCVSVIEREMATDAGIRKHRREKYPPPGMLDRCRKKIMEVCDIDITEALTKTAPRAAAPPAPTPYRKYRTPTADDRDRDENNNEPPKPKLNLTECLEKHFQLKSSPPTPWKPPRWMTPIPAAHLPRHIRQERPSNVGSKKSHPALREKGNPFPQILDRTRSTTSTGKPGKSSDRVSDRQTSTVLRPGMSTTQGKPGPNKGGGAMSLLMPIYTVGIVVFFLYTMSKMLLRSPQERPETKVVEFHNDPEYRSYMVRHKYENGGQPLSYKEFLRKKEDEERKRSAISLLGGVGRKQVFTAIEGIIAEMDEYRERVTAEQNQKTDEDVEWANGESNHGPVSDHVDKVSKDKLEDELARITALDVKEEVDIIQEKLSPLPDANVEVSNIVLEASMPPDAQLLVAESECLTHTITDHIDGWSDVEDQAVVVTGKMTISLVGNREASVHSTETRTSKESQVRPSTPMTPEVDEAPAPSGKIVDSSSEDRRHIEKLANALVDDVFRNQVPRFLENSASTRNESQVNPTSKRSGIGSQKKQFSRESVSSQSSSFEYVSASQDDQHLQTAIVEEDMFGVDVDGELDIVRGFRSTDGQSSRTSGEISMECNGNQGFDGQIFRDELSKMDGGHEIKNDEEVDSRDQTPELKEIRRVN